MPFTKTASSTIPAIERKSAKKNASRGEIRPEGSGLPDVRFIRRSSSISQSWLKALGARGDEGRSQKRVEEPDEVEIGRGNLGSDDERNQNVPMDHDEEGDTGLRQFEGHARATGSPFRPGSEPRPPLSSSRLSPTAARTPATSEGASGEVRDW